MDELGQDSGLDPLGMQRPIEVIYQSPVGRDLMSGRPTRPSCLILEGYSVDVVLCFFGFGPPLAFVKAFSRSGCGRIFSLFSRVMRPGLLTGTGTKRPGSVLSGPIFSEPVDCADLVNFSQATQNAMFSRPWS